MNGLNPAHMESVIRKAKEGKLATGQAALHGAIDDATGTVMGLFFDKEEALKGYYEMMRQILNKYGIPEAFYGDKWTIFEFRKPSSLVQGQSSVQRKCARYAGLAGLKLIKLHEFCHSCLSNSLASGLSVRVVARRVGNTERMVRETYSHLLPSEKNVIKDFFDDLNDINSDGDPKDE